MPKTTYEVRLKIHTEQERFTHKGYEVRIGLSKGCESIYEIRYAGDDDCLMIGNGDRHDALFHIRLNTSF